MLWNTVYSQDQLIGMQSKGCWMKFLDRKANISLSSFEMQAANLELSTHTAQTEMKLVSCSGVDRSKLSIKCSTNFSSKSWTITKLRNEFSSKNGLKKMLSFSDITLVENAFPKFTRSI